MNRRILVCSHTGIFKGGAEKSLFLFLKYTPIPKQDFLVTVPFYEKDGLYERLVRLGVPARLVSKDRDPTHFPGYLWNPLSLLKRLVLRLGFAVRFGVLLKRFRPRLVYINTQHCGTEAVVAGCLGRKVIYHIRGLMGGWKYRVPIIRRLASGIVVVSQSERQTLLRHRCRQTIAVIPNGIELAAPVVNRHRPEKPEGSVVILNVSHIEPRKGTDVFFRLAEKIVREYPGAVFWHVGRVVAEPSGFYDSLVRAYSAWIEAGRILLFGFQDDVYDFIDKCDIFLFPSRQEGSPRAVLEAMLLGKPVVSFNRDGQREQVVDGETGYLVGSEHEMLEKIRLLIGDKTLREDMGRMGQRRVRDCFDVAGYARHLTDYLLSALDAAHE